MTVVTSMESPSCCVSSRSSSQGWKAIRLSNGLVELHLVPEIGGRVIQLTLGAQEFFYVNRRHAGRIYPAEENCLASGWKNYGAARSGRYRKGGRATLNGPELLTRFWTEAP